jgi:hypothetical protein
MVIALVHILGFAAAGLFSSRVASSSTEVLVRSPNCGDLSVILEDWGKERKDAISVFTRFMVQITLSLATAHPRDFWLRNNSNSTTKSRSRPRDHLPVRQRNVLGLGHRSLQHRYRLRRF